MTCMGIKRRSRTLEIQQTSNLRFEVLHTMLMHGIHCMEGAADPPTFTSPSKSPGYLEYGSSVTIVREETSFPIATTATSCVLTDVLSFKACLIDYVVILIVTVLLFKRGIRTLPSLLLPISTMQQAY